MVLKEPNKTHIIDDNFVNRQAQAMFRARYTNRNQIPHLTYPK